MGIFRNISPRDADRLIDRQRSYIASKMNRDHEIELLLDAGIELAEAISIVDRRLADD